MGKPVIVNINGVEYKITRDASGKKVYDPPRGDDDKRFNAKFDRMLESKSAPRGMTDSVFLEGRGTLLDQLDGDEEGVEELVRLAKKQGYTPSARDVYMDNIAERPGDPAAFVNADARGHVKRVCEQRGWAIRGAVNVDSREPESDPWDERKDLGEDIVREEVARRRMNPENSARSYGDLREEVIDTHALKD